MPRSSRTREAHQSFKRVEARLAGNAPLRTTAQASLRMSNVRQHGTAPERAVRRIATSLGLRYRTSNRDLPGSPDLANRKRGFAVFVHGCYWHRHANCSRATTPKTNPEFWVAKFAANQARDRKSVEQLASMGYKVVVLWECETTDEDAVRRTLAKLRE